MRPKFKVIHLIGAEFSRLEDGRKVRISACGMYKRNHFKRFTRDPYRVTCTTCMNTRRYRRETREEVDDND